MKLCVLLCSVTALETHHYVAGQQITMRLMRKPRGSLRVLPAAEAADCADAQQQFPPSATGLEANGKDNGNCCLLCCV